MEEHTVRRPSRWIQIINGMLAATISIWLLIMFLIYRLGWYDPLLTSVDELLEVLSWVFILASAADLLVLIVVFMRAPHKRTAFPSFTIALAMVVLVLWGIAFPLSSWLSSRGPF